MGEKRGMKALEAWCRKVTGGYRDVRVSNMTTSWRDGLAFCAIIHHFQPDLIDFDTLSKENIYQNNNLAFSVAEQRLGIPALLDAEDMVKYEVPDKLSILTYVSQLYQHFHGMEASKKSPAKRPLDESGDRAAGPPTESPGKRSAIEVPAPVAAAAAPQRRNDVCHACRNRVYILERLIVDNRLYHRTCFQCSKCRAVLQPGSYVEGDQPDLYECLRCPEEDDGPKRRLGAKVFRPFSDVTKEVDMAVTLRTALSARGAVNSAAVASPNGKGPSQPAIFKPLEISTAASEARHVFHAQILGTTDVDPTPVTDTGQRELNSVGQDLPEEMVGVVSPTDASPMSVAMDEEAVTPRPSSLPVIQASHNGPTGIAQNTVALEPPIPPISDLASSVDDSLGEVDYPSAVSISSPLVSTDEQNNNVEETPKPPLEKPPPPPSSDDNCRETSGQRAKPAIPQKPSSIPERPQTLHIRTNAQRGLAVKTVGSDDERTAKSIVLARDDPSISSGGSSSVVVPETVTPVTNANQVSEIDDQKAGDLAKPAPVAAPRASKSRTTQEPPKVLIEETCEMRMSPEKILLEGQAPTPRRRSSLPNKADDGAVLDQEPHPPPKPPRRMASPRRTHPSLLPAKPPEYPEVLNPFGDDGSGEDEKEAPAVAGATSVPPTVSTGADESLNPFGDSDESEGESLEASAGVKEPMRRVIPCDHDRLNPFASDLDSDEEKSSNDDRPLDASMYRHHGSGSGSVKSDRLQSVRQSVDVGMRKKRPAPQPPSSTGTGSENSSPRITPCPSPRPHQKTPAPLPPTCSPHPHHRSSVSPRKFVSVPQTSHDSITNGSFLTEKSLKELDNMNRTKLDSSHRPNQADSSSECLLSPDSLESQSSAATESSTNTFGNWKRKKRPAPALPIPQRRQIQKIPMKEIQSELLEIEEKQVELEKQGVEIEKLIRDKFSDEVDPSDEEEELILQLFELVNKKNALFRRQTELIYLKRQQRLEEEHADLEFQIRCLMQKPEEKKTDEDRALEEQLIARLVEVVKQRSEIVESMEMDRLREEQEDRSIQEQLSIHQGSLDTLAGPSGREKTKNKDKKKKKKSKKHEMTKDEDKDTDEADSSKGTLRVKDKKKKWLFG